jgi:hypothetical protein
MREARRVGLTMKSKCARLRIAAMVGIAWTSACAGDPYRTFKLSWATPMHNEDGSLLIDLQGYYVYVGLTPEALAPLYFTTDSTALFGAGTVRRYVAVTSVNTSGLESALSAVVSLPVVP